MFLSLSHFSLEGQGAWLLYRAGQPFLQRGLWAGNEGGYTPTLSSPTDQERYYRCEYQEQILTFCLKWFCYS